MVSFINSLIVLAIAVGTQAQSAELLPPSLPTVASQSWTGNGCRADNIEYTAGKSNFTLDSTSIILHRFNAAIGPDADPTIKAENCQTYVNVRGIVAGWQFSVKSMSLHGYADMEDVNLTVYATAEFAGRDPSPNVCDTQRNCPRN